ncbi:MAG: hypothetical protein WCG51_04210 [Elusimicrobiota bacterium]
MADILKKFVEQVVAAYGSQLVSVVLYGSKASGNDVKKHSDHNVLLVLADAGFAELKKLQGKLGWWKKEGNRPPLIFSKAMLASSTDVFPIEFGDMKDNHKVLWGEDVFTALSIADDNLRHQCEFELKGKLLRLRQLYIESNQKARELQAIMIATISPVIAVSRHIMRLVGEPIPGDKVQAMERLAHLAGFEYAALGAVVALKKGDADALRADPAVLFENYINAVGKLADFVDKL